ncbi:MAG: type II toxin-antitoxin system MqsR family toxin [Deltaproteobacteria bacterium]|nr:type II toxin-antitoxin system MqsR family toxin [Deltaproteobacteria bacterium]
MEKRKSHYSLDRIKELVKADRWKMTLTAERNAWEQFHLDADGVKTVILGLKPGVFYKSMTTITDATLWQDVYHPVVGGKEAYVKLQIAEGNSVIIQFKEK